MFILASTSDLLTLITSSVADLHVHASWVDLVDAATTATPGRTNTIITTATTTTIVASPGASTKRTLNTLLLRNKHASTSQDVTIRHTDGTTVVELPKFTLLAGEYAILNGQGVLFVYDANGGVKSAISVLASDTATGIIRVATQAEQETGSAVDRAVTPGRQHFHPSAPKCWLTCGVTANILASYNITSLTDTGVGDVAVTINVDFSSALYAAVVSVQRTNSTAAAANARCGTIKTASLAAGSLSMDCWDDTAATNVIADPTTWHMHACGDLA